MTPINPILVGFALIFAGIANAQDATTPPEVSETTQVKEQTVQQAERKSEPDVEADAARVAEKRKKTTIAMAALGGIAILGVSAIMIVMLWARRLRRLARDFGPPQKTIGNDFWFLKPPKQTLKESTADISKDHPPPSEMS